MFWWKGFGMFDESMLLGSTVDVTKGNFLHNATHVRIVTMWTAWMRHFVGSCKDKGYLSFFHVTTTNPNKPDTNSLNCVPLSWQGCLSTKVEQTRLPRTVMGTNAYRDCPRVFSLMSRTRSTQTWTTNSIFQWRRITRSLVAFNPEEDHGRDWSENNESDSSAIRVLWFDRRCRVRRADRHHVRTSPHGSYHIHLIYSRYSRSTSA